MKLGDAVSGTKYAEPSADDSIAMDLKKRPDQEALEKLPTQVRPETIFVKFRVVRVKIFLVFRKQIFADRKWLTRDSKLCMACLIFFCSSLRSPSRLLSLPNNKEKG